MIILPLLSLISFLISLITVALIKQRFSQLLLDIPNERSSHSQPTPRGGGLGFIIGFAITNVIALTLSLNYPNFSLNLTPQQGLYLWLTLTPLALVGIIDDRQGVPSRIRYLIQIASAGIAVTAFGFFPQPWLTSFGLGGTIIAFILTLIAFTAFINFYNFMDGLDGLLAGVSLVQMSFLAIHLNQPFLWLLNAAILGFLWWNWSPAKIFMGDAGSTVLGATIAIALLLPNNSAAQAWSTIAITLPIVGDAIYTLIRRLIRKENIFAAHRSHIYQRLQQQGWTHSQVAITYMVLTGAIAILISTLRLRGSGLSIILILGAIILSEVYLSQHKITAKLEGKK